MQQDNIYAGVVIDQAHPSIDRIFHYIIPAEIRAVMQPGMRVLVPFGPRNKMTEAYLMRIDRNIEIEMSKLKPIKKALDPYPIIPPFFIPMIEWMKNEYHCMYIEAIHCFTPPGIRENIKKKYVKMIYLRPGIDLDYQIEHVQKRSEYMARILKVLANYGELSHGKLSMDKVIEMTDAPLSSFKALEKRKLIDIVKQEVFRDPWQKTKSTAKIPLKLTQEQEKAVSTIGGAIGKGPHKFILHGVTGSGKTEVYIRSVEIAIAQKKQAIVLVPEISLTPQTIDRFKSRFGDQVAVLHSKLSNGERFDEWRKIRNGLVSIVVGARSAIFAPFTNLGIIIIDEAHEDSYKSDSRPRYHTIDVARMRCINENAVMVLGTATPGLEEYTSAQNGEYTIVEMGERVDKKPLPPVEIVDMRREIEKGNRSIFSGQLYTALHETLQRGTQAILFLNRRGYANFVSCRACGWVAKCRKCDISLTYHADTNTLNTNTLKCHYCGSFYRYPAYCPSCGSKYVKSFGIGTQKVEEQLKKYFPNARTVRMDMDTTSNKGSHQRILDGFKNLEYDILLGTQMIAKGLDFPNVTLVGVITADTSINLPDYRSAEKTFQLITQVAGRTGRGDLGGRVIVQTYQPDHYAIQYASKHDYSGFYKEEIKIRKRFLYPPFCKIIKVLLTGPEEKNIIDLANNMNEWLKHKINGSEVLNQGIISLGAYPAPLERINNKYRWQILFRIKTDNMFKNAYHELIDELLSNFDKCKETIIVDFYPISLL